MMKKTKFANLSDEILTRDELKRIVGGNGSGDCYVVCADSENTRTVTAVDSCPDDSEGAWAYCDAESTYVHCYCL